MRYNSRPELVEAYQYTFPLSDDMRHFIELHGYAYDVEWSDFGATHELTIANMREGDTYMKEGEWLVVLLEEQGIVKNYVVMVDEKFKSRYYT